jgi:hypothetical protein
MSFPAVTPLEVISLGDISISLARGHYQFASTASPETVLHVDLYGTAVVLEEFTVQ